VLYFFEVFCGDVGLGEGEVLFGVGIVLDMLWVCLVVIILGIDCLLVVGLIVVIVLCVGVRLNLRILFGIEFD